MWRWRNSIHIAIRLWERRVFFQAASLASDECENVQNRGDSANVSGNAHEPIFHAWMFGRQRNIIPLAIGQAILGSLIFWAFPLAWHHHLRVGPGYYSAWPL